MATEKVEDMIRKGYMVFEANTEYAGQPWELPANVLADYTAAFNELRDLDTAATGTKTRKENECAKGAVEQKKCEQILWDLKKFIKVVQPDEDLQQQMFHDLGIDDKFPYGDSEFLKLLYEEVKPHLGDWDGTDQEIPAATKAEINAQIAAYATAVGDCDEWKANATTATDAVQQGVANFITERARVRNWLYLKLPDQKYDAHLDEYGFKIWDKPTYGGGEEEPEPGELPEIPDAPVGVYATFSVTPVIHILVGCGPFGEHTGFDVRKLVTGEGVAKEPTMPDTNHATNIDLINEPLMDTDIQPGKKHWYWVRARNGEEVGEWAAVVWAVYPVA